MNRLLTILALLGAMSAAWASDPVLAPNAPKDRVVEHASQDAMARLLAPYVEAARASYPGARKRFQAGLPKGESFFVTTRLRDDRGTVEQVFVAVSDIRGGSITGRIWNDVVRVQGYRRGQVHTFPESELVDWLITKPDGTEEGNVVGKFLDTYRR